MAEKITLSEDELKYSETKLNETKENLKVCLPDLRKYLYQEVNLQTDDYTLLKFLRVTKFDVEKAKKKVKCYYKLRSECDWFKNRDPHIKEMDELLKLGLVVPLLKRDEDGSCVIIMRTGKHDVKSHTLDQVSKAGLFILDLLYDRFEFTSVYGIKVIFDLGSSSLRHASQFSLSIIRRIVHLWQDCYPISIKSLDLINSPMYMNVLVGIFRTFISPKLRHRIHILGYDQESLFNHYKKEILPEEYGGTDGTIDTTINYWRDAVINNKEWLMQSEL